MRSNTLLKRALSLAIFAMSSAVGAVSLGDLTVLSHPGEPMEATLKIEDLDLTISPLLVRVAPPATYMRVGVNWPQQVQDLKLVRDGSSNAIQVKVIGTKPIDAQSFPLLIELNAGGKISVRNYQIVSKNGRFHVLEGHTAPSLSGAALTTAPTVPVVPLGDAHKAALTPSNQDSQSVAQQVAQAKANAKTHTKIEQRPLDGRPMMKDVKKVDAKASVEKDEKLPLFNNAKPVPVPSMLEPKLPTNVHTVKKTAPRKHRAPEIVRQYVALNGFDASQPFKVQKSMTLWSVAKLYWPSYRGATLEQLLIAFRDHNPNGFEKGDPNVLLNGAILNPPSMEDVFDIEPQEAFRLIHGANTPVPPPTQNLIDAQKVSNTLAGSVADAQDAVRTEGKSETDITQAGRATLESGKSLMTQTDAAVGQVVEATKETIEKAAEEHLTNTTETENVASATQPSADATSGVQPNAPVPATMAASVSTAETPAPQVTVTDNTVQASVATQDGKVEQVPVPADDVADATTAGLAQGKSLEEAQAMKTEVAQDAVAAKQSETTKAVKQSTESHEKPVILGAKDAGTTPATSENTSLNSLVTGEPKLPSDTANVTASTSSTTEAPKEEAKDTPVSTPASEPVVKEEAKATANTAPAKTTTEEPTPYWWAGIGLLALLLLGWFIKTRKKDEEPEDDRKQGVLVKTEIKPATAAQLSAVEKTVDEAVKNGTTAGAMGVGSMAYSEALQKELKQNEPLTVAVAPEQPWLDPNDQELPPLPEDANTAAGDLAKHAEQTQALLEEVDLSLEAAADDAKVAQADAPAQKEPPVSNKEMALQAALEAKYNLAKSFVGIGAVNEALELLDEVRRRGTADQRARATELAASIPAKKLPDGEVASDSTDKPIA